ncbi:hypothetical protein [uncultured Clostridium sp.]|uniref:hypothetical protein n=1 Tax=uncultured Clostridium sp. TaxID=59620 RepID=UPI0028E87B30|nr:hypothetical protein [uncultured Clostridium sp.]
MGNTSKEVDKGKKDSMYAMLFFGFLIVGTLIMVLWNNRPMTLERRMNEIAEGKKNVLGVEFYERSGEMPSRLNVQIAIRPIYDEEHYKEKFAQKVTSICASVSEIDVDDIVVLGYIETMDNKDNDTLKKYCMFTSKKEQRQNVNWENFMSKVKKDHESIKKIGALSK